jgi:hypothetical protein
VTRKAAPGGEAIEGQYPAVPLDELVERQRWHVGTPDDLAAVSGCDNNAAEPGSESSAHGPNLRVHLPVCRAPAVHPKE